MKGSVINTIPTPAPLTAHASTSPSFLPRWLGDAGHCITAACPGSMVSYLITRFVIVNLYNCTAREIIQKFMAATTRQRRSNQGHGSLRQSLGPPSRNPVEETIKSAVGGFGRAGSLSSLLPAALQSQASRKSNLPPHGSRASSAGVGTGRKRYIACSKECIVSYANQ